MLVQPYGVKKYLNCALWGKSIKLGTVIVLVVPTIFSYGPHSNLHGGEAHCALGSKGSWPFCLIRKGLKEEKSGLKNVCIPIFLTVVQNEPYKISVTYFIKRFYENVSTKCVNDSCQRKIQVEASYVMKGGINFELKADKYYTCSR